MGVRVLFILIGVSLSQERRLISMAKNNDMEDHEERHGQNNVQCPPPPKYSIHFHRYPLKYSTDTVAYPKVCSFALCFDLSVIHDWKTSILDEYLILNYLNSDISSEHYTGTPWPIKCLHHIWFGYYSIIQIYTQYS